MERTLHRNLEPSISLHGGGPYSPYPPQQKMSHSYPQHPDGLNVQQLHYCRLPENGISVPYPTTDASAPGHRPKNHRRPRRKYDEITRSYKCGWNNCKRAYGTLNHLNTHITQLSHGLRRTPAEFPKIIRKWNASGRAKDSPYGQDANNQSQPLLGNQEVQLPPISYQSGAQVAGLNYRSMHNQYSEYAAPPYWGFNPDEYDGPKNGQH